MEKPGHDAKKFQINIENYSELDFYKHENDMRRVLQGLISPVMRRQEHDRDTFITFQQKLDQVQGQVHILQDIVFQRDNTGRMALFDRIFQEIRNVDQERIRREQELIGQQRIIQQNQENMKFEIEQHKNTQNNFDNILQQLNNDLMSHSQRQLEWQDGFLKNYDEN